jgi:hypothetical protein
MSVTRLVTSVCSLPTLHGSTLMAAAAWPEGQMSFEVHGLGADERGGVVVVHLVNAAMWVVVVAGVHGMNEALTDR